jgi:hypothetical protein
MSAMERNKPKYNVGQRMWCCICGTPITILRVSSNGKRVVTSCSMNGKFSDIDAETELRFLTKREAAKDRTLNLYG